MKTVSTGFATLPSATDGPDAISALQDEIVVEPGFVGERAVGVQSVAGYGDQAYAAEFDLSVLPQPRCDFVTVHAR